MSFHIGQRVRLVKCENPNCVHKVGDIGEVDALPGHALNDMDPIIRSIHKALNPYADRAYRVLMQGGAPLFAPADHLAPVFDDHQGVNHEELLKALPELEAILGAPA